MKQYTGRTLEEVLASIASEQECRTTDITYNVLEEEKGGIFGIHKSVTIEAFTAKDVKEFIFDYLGNYFTELNQGVSIEIIIEKNKEREDELKIPSFLYEESCTKEERRNLANCRKGQFEGMNEKLQLDEWQPDYGDRKIHPTAGIIAIGARMPLVAFNVNLDTDNIQIAKDIAKAIRGSSAGFKYCKALGVKLEDRGIVQVTMNMVNYQKTPLFYAYEMIKTLANRYGVNIIGTEIIGLTPAEALIDCAEFYLKIENFDCKKQVLEYSLIGEE